VLHRLPAPIGEFRLVAAGGVGDVDLVLIADEAHRVPFLPLPAIFALPGLPDDLARDVVGEPLLDLAELLDRADIGFLVKLAQRRGPSILARIDAALRHLPGMDIVDVFRPVDAAPDEHAAVAVEHHQPDAGAVRERFVARHASPRVPALQPTYCVYPSISACYEHCRS